MNCPTCKTEMWVSPRGKFCPNGHTKIFPLEKEDKTITVFRDDDMIECETCQGTGEVDCDECDGSGTHTCPRCDQEDGECEECDGDGQVECPTCDGNGVIAGRKLVKA